MTEKDLTDRKFYRAGEESRFADEAPDRTPQTEHPAYKLAFRDHDFLLRGDVFSTDLVEAWIDYKRENEVNEIAIRPHPYEFSLYFDV